MKKLLFLVAFLSSLCLWPTARAEIVTDVLTRDKFYTGEGTTANIKFQDVTLTSEAVYFIKCALDSRQDNPMVFKPNNEFGIVTTKSGGNVKSVTVKFGDSHATNKVVEVYAKNTPYDTPADLATNSSEDVKGVKVGTFTTNGDPTHTFTIEGDYQYFGISPNGKSTLNTFYITEVTVEWETGGGEVVDDPYVYKVGQEVTVNHKIYKVAGENIVPNYNFADGTYDGWVRNDDGKAVDANCWEILGEGLNGANYLHNTGKVNGGSGSEANIRHTWELEAGKTYMASYWTKGSSDWVRFWNSGLEGVKTPDNDLALLIGENSEDWMLNATVFEATEEAHKALLNCAYCGNKFGLTYISIVPVEFVADEVVEYTTIEPNTYYNFNILDTDLYLSADWDGSKPLMLTIGLGSATSEQVFQFVPVEGKEDVYNILGLDGKAFYTPGGWDCTWNGEPTEEDLATAEYQFGVQPEVGYMLIKTKNKYVGSDGIWSWSKLWSDKGLDKAVKFVPVKYEAPAPDYVELDNIAGLAALTPEQAEKSIKLTLTDAKVTYYDAKMDLYFVEDASGAMQLGVAGVEGLAQGKQISGSVLGTYFDGMLVANAEDVEITSSADVDVALGTVMTLAEAMLPANVNKLATFVASDAMSIVDADGEMMVIEGESAISAFDAFGVFPEDYAYPATAEKVTGILYDFGGLVLAFRTEADIVAATTPVVPTVTVTDVLTNANTVKSTATTYADIKDVTVTSDAVYSLNAAGGNSSIQLRTEVKNNLYSGIVSTVSGGTLKSVTVTFNSNTAAARTLDVYAKNTAYTATSDLYSDDTQGTKVASFTMSNGATQTYTFEGDYEYIGLRSNNNALYLDKVEIEWETAGAAVLAPVFSPAAGFVKAGTEVTLSTQTEGAEIYYTLDESEPTAASTKYTEPIVINDYALINAVAILNGEASKVVTAEYMAIPEIEDLSPIMDFPDATPFVVNCELTVAYANGAYVYVYDGNNYALVYKYDLGLEAGDVIAAGWDAKISIYNGLVEIVPTSELAKSESAPKAVKPMPVDAEDAEYTLAAYNVNRYFTLNGVVFDAATPANKAHFTGKMGEFEVPFRNNFAIESVEAGTYNVTGFLSVYNANIQFQPIAYEVPATVCDNIAALAALTEEQAMNVVLNLADAKVTYYAEGISTYFVEDATAAMKLQIFDENYEPAAVEAIAQGKAITGTLAGMYVEGQFMAMDTDIDITASEDADVTYGTEMTVAEAKQPANALKLATFVASDAVTITRDEDALIIKQGEDEMLVMDVFYSFPDDYEFPAAAEKVTGILMSMGSMTFVVPRDPADIVAVVEDATIEPNVYYNLQLLDTELYLSAGWQDNNHQVNTLSLGQPGYEQVFKFVPVADNEGKYNIIGLDGKALYASGSWDFFWNDAPTAAHLASADYQFTVESEPGFIYIKTKNNYVGSDGIWGWSKLWTDKGLDKAVKFSPIKCELPYVVVDNIAALAELTEEEAMAVRLNFVGAKVTYYAEGMGVYFVEDATAAMQLFVVDENFEPATVEAIAQGKQIGGSFIGMYTEGMFMALDTDVNITASADVDVATGTVMTLAEALKPENANKLVTFEASDALTIVYDEDAMVITEGEANMLATDVFYSLPEGYEYPAKAKQITGIIYAVGQTVLAVRSEADIVAAGTDGINAIDAEGNVEYYNMQGVRLSAPAIGQPCIRVANGKAVKVIIK